jgi:hypothetical protein
MRLGDAEIAHLEGSELENVTSKKRTRAYMQGIRLGHQILPSKVHVYSPWVVRWTLAAESRDAAWEAVERRLPRLLAALNALPHGPYRVEMMRLGEVDLEAGTITNEQSGWGTGGVWGFGPDVQALSESEKADATAVLAALANDDKWDIAHHFQEALSLLDLRQGLPASMAAAAFTSFHRFIEGVVQQAYPARIKTAGTRTDERAIIEALLRKLQNNHRKGKHAAAVQEAAKELARLDNQGFRGRLARTVQELGGAQELAAELDEFYSFRNRYFAHSGVRINDALAHEWSRRASTACRELLRLWTNGNSADETLHEPEVLVSGGQDYPVRVTWHHID